jgi:hypothetical protein
MKYGGLNIASRQEVLQDGSGAAGVPDEGEPIRRTPGSARVAAAKASTNCTASG